MTVEKLIRLLQKINTQEAITIMRVNERGLVEHFPIDNVVVRHDMETDSVVVILERENTK